MAYKLEWDKSGERLYHAGVKNVVLYKQNSSGNYVNGEAWNGVTSINENPSGAEETKLFADDIKYLGMRSAEEYGATLGCYMYPDGWKECDGRATPVPGLSIGQQKRKPFGLSYITTVGNDTEGENYGYVIHLAYGLTASPSEQSHETINDSPEAGEFSYELSSTPVNVTDYKPTSVLEIESWKFSEEKMEAFKQILYGTPAGDGVAAVDAVLPLPDAVIAHFRTTSGSGETPPAGETPITGQG